MDEPFGSMTMVAGYCLFEEAARQNIRVLLNGQGADEILAGYEKFYQPFFQQLWRQKNGISLLRNFIGYQWHHSVSFWHILTQVKRQLRGKKAVLPWLQPGFMPPPERQFRRSPETNIRTCSLNLIQEIGLPMLLHYEDRNSMAHSVEARVPFLDHRLVEFCLSLPDDLKISGGIRKHILREALSDILPEKIYRRYDKLSFICPESVWMRQHAPFFRQTLEQGVQEYPHIFNHQLLTAFDAYCAGKRHDDPPFWRAFIFIEWLNEHLRKYTNMLMC
jgi:asparagine synthase (glutamine-hydrolysing)